MASAGESDLTAAVKKIGILGGSFDPVHNGHLAIAQSAARAFGLETVILVPAYCPPHKSRPILAPFEHRYAMLLAAVQDASSHLTVSDIERKECCPSYAGRTVEDLKQLYPGAAFYFITGLDMLPVLTSWEHARMYPGLCCFIGTTRPGFDADAVNRVVPRPFRPYVFINEMPALSISSTDIKQRLRSGQPISGMVPYGVLDYITKHNIYTRCLI